MTLALLGWGGALAIGLALGLLGSGGSIVTVPVLVYLFGQPEKLAIAGSLGIVGVVATAGAVLHARQGALVPRVAVVFAPAGMVGSWLGAAGSQFVSGATQLRVFALAMLAAAALMLVPAVGAAVQRAAGQGEDPHGGHASIWRLLVIGLAVGALTGFVGVGGGFLIVPALVIGAGLAMHRAVGTSLTVIAFTAFAGFAKHLLILSRDGIRLDYGKLAAIALIGVIGSLLGQRFGSRLPAAQLRRMFGIALLLLALFILWNRRAH